MNGMTTLSQEWHHWIATNLQRDCTQASIVEAMVRDNFDPIFARATVLHLAANRNAASTEQTVVGQPGVVRPAPALEWPVSHSAKTPHYVYEGSRIAAGNVVQTFDRAVRVAIRLEKPDVILFDGVLSDEECETLIDMSSTKLKRSTTVDPVSGAPIFEERRSSYGTFFLTGENEFIAKLDRRIGELMNWPVANGEGIQILNYHVGGEYKPHYDYFPPDDAGSAVHMRQGGQRVASLVMYLNNVEEGGETIFPELGLSICPKRGSAVYFAYTNSRGQIDPLTYHGGAPVKRGEKWIATKWMRERAYG